MSLLTLTVLVVAAVAGRTALLLWERSSGHTFQAVRETLDAFAIAGAVALAFTLFIARIYYIPSSSMEPTLHVKDVVLVNEFGYRVGSPKFGDVAVFTPPIPSDADFIKRVIGVAGDRLRIHAGVVYRNGIALHEPEIAAAPAYELQIRDYGILVDGSPLDRSQANLPPREAWRASDRIPEGYVFLMGDNRNNSDDSHIWGFAQVHGTFVSGPLAGRAAGFRGKAMILCWPFTRARWIEPAVAAQPQR